VVGTSLDDGPKTSLDFDRSAATVIPTLLVAVRDPGPALGAVVQTESDADGEDD
jgi:hypothetical protein